MLFYLAHFFRYFGPMVNLITTHTHTLGDAVFLKKSSSFYQKVHIQVLYSGHGNFFNEKSKFLIKNCEESF